MYSISIFRTFVILSAPLLTYASVEYVCHVATNIRISDILSSVASPFQ